MPFTVTKNRIRELRNTVELVANRKHRSRSMRKPADRSGFIMLTHLKNRAPEGRDEPIVYHRGSARPSIRQHGITLFSGWGDPDVEETDRGVKFVALSNAPHMGILLEGSPPHRIPRSGGTPLSFYDFARRQSVFTLFIEQHPGFKRRLEFIAESLKVSLPFISGQLRSGMRTIMSPVRRFFE